MAKSTITFKLIDLLEEDVSASVVSARLVPASGSRHAPVNRQQNAVASPAPVSAAFNDDGEATLALTRTSSLDAGWTWTVEIAGEHGVWVWDGLSIPDGDRDFTQIVEQLEPGQAPRYVVLTQDELTRLIAQAPTAGIRTAAPLSGTGITGDPATIADGAIDGGAKLADDSVDLQKLDAAVRDDIQDSVDVNQISISGQDLTFQSHGTANRTVTLPSGPDSTADVAALDARVENLEALEKAERTEEALVTRARIVVSQRNTAYSLGARVPADSAGRDLVALVEAVGEPDGRTVIDLTDLLAKAKVTRDGATIFTSNSVDWSNPPDNNTYRLGVDTQGDLFFGSDTADTYYVTVVDSLPGASDEHIQDVVGGMVTGNTETGGSLTYDDATGKLNLEVTGGGEDAASWAEEGNTDPIPAGKLTNAPAGTDEASVNRLIKAGVSDWAETANTDPIPASKLANAPGGSANELEPLAAVPSDTSGAAGLIANVKGVLWELVASGEAPNVTSGEAVANPPGAPAGYFGNAYVAWDTDAQTDPVIAWARSSTLESIWIRFHGAGPHAFYGSFDLTARRAARDKLIGGVQYYAYAGGSDAVGENVVAGSYFSATFTEGSADGAAVDIHGAVKRWELDAREDLSEINARIEAEVESWARDATTPIPAGKLANAPGATTPPTGSSRGDLLATSRPIVTTTPTWRGHFATTGGADSQDNWIIADAGTDNGVTQIGRSRLQLGLPRDSPNDGEWIGLWVACEIGGVEVSSAFTPWSIGGDSDLPHSAAAPTDNVSSTLILPMGTETAATVPFAVVTKVMRYVTSPYGTPLIQIRSGFRTGQNNPAANTTFKVYSAVVRGAAGPRGERGPAGTVVAAIAPSALAANANLSGGPSADSFGSWVTLCTSAALTAENAGQRLVLGWARYDSPTSGTRSVVETRITRQVGAGAEEEIAARLNNVASYGSGIVGTVVSAADAGAEGTVYRVAGRVRPAGSGSRTLRALSAGTHMQVVSVGGVRGPAGPRGEPGTGGGGLTQTQVDARVVAGTKPFARVDSSEDVPAGLIPDLPAGQITSGTFAAARIPDLPASRITSGEIADARIPSGIARDTEVDAARAAPWARNTGRAGTAPDAAIPAGIARDAEVDTKINTALPAKRRPPDYGAGDVGEVLTVRSGSAIGWNALPAGAGGVAFTSGEQTKLAGIPADAEANVNADWDAASGDARILNKPTIPDAPADWAKASGASGRAPKTALPTDTVYTDDLPQAVGTRFEETFPGLSPTRTDTDVRPAAPRYLSPALDLDTHQHGEFHLSLELSIAPARDTNMGFRQGGSNQTAADRRRALSNIIFASDLAEAGDFVFSSTGDLAGVEAFAVPVWSGSTRAGTYYLLLVHNSSNEAGAYHWYDGEAGATGATFTAELRVAFQPADVPAAGPTKTTLTAGAALTWDLDAGSVADVTLTANATLGVPTNGVDAGVYMLRVKQPASGNFTLTLNASIDTGGLDAPTLSTDSNAVDYLLFSKRGTTVDYLGIRSGYG